MKPYSAITFDLADFPANKAAAVWQRQFEMVHRASILPIPGRPMTSRFDSWPINGLWIMRGQFNPQIMELDIEKDRVFKREKYLCVWVLLSGRLNILHDGEILDIGPGEFFLIGHVREAFALLTEAEMVCVVLPHRVVGYDAAKHPSRVRIRANDEKSTDLVRQISAIAQLPDQLSPAKASELAESYRTLILSTLEREENTDRDAVHLDDAILDYIDERILDPDLSFNDLTERFQMSRAALVSEVEQLMHLPTYLQQRRLDYALRSLAFGGKGDAWLSEVAVRIGFADRETFETAFEAQFGFPPSVILGVLAHAAPKLKGSNQKRLWDHWLQAEA